VSILTANDYYTNWIEVVLLKYAKDEQVIAFLESNIIFRFGLPFEILSDKRPAFISGKLTQFYNKYGVKHITSSNYYP
jgi:hypothetical protein